MHTEKEMLVLVTEGSPLSLTKHERSALVTAVPAGHR